MLNPIEKKFIDASITSIFNGGQELKYTMKTWHTFPSFLVSSSVSLRFKKKDQIEYYFKERKIHCP